MHLFETIIEVAQQNDNPSWIFYVNLFRQYCQIIKRVKILNYIISNSDQSHRKVTNPKNKSVQMIQKSYIGHLKKIAETLMKCIEKNSHYQVWIEDQSKWAELVEMVQKQQCLLKGKLGEEEQKQKFQLKCNPKNSLLNRRKQLMEGKKDSSGENSVNNQEVFQRLNSPIKKTITLQVGVQKLIKRINEDDDEINESVSSLQSKKDLQNQQSSTKFSMDSPMLKGRNSTPLMSSMNISSNSLQSQQPIGLRTPKTPLLSTPTRTSSNTPQTPSVKKLLLNSPLQKNSIKYDSMLSNKDTFDINDQSKDKQQENQKKSSGRESRFSEYNNKISLESEDLSSLDSSNSSKSSVDSQKSNSPLRKQTSKRMKTREIHNSLLKDLDISYGGDESYTLTHKHSIKIDQVGFQYINKKEKRLFDWYQHAEDEEEQEKLRIHQDECFNKILQEQNQNSVNCLNLFNPDAPQAMDYKRAAFLNNTYQANLIKLNSPIYDSIKNQDSSPHKSFQNDSPIENNKCNSFDDIAYRKEYLKASPSNNSNGSPTLNLNGSPFYSSQTNSSGLKRKVFNTGSPCIELNKQYFRYLIRDTIRKYSYEPSLDPKIKAIKKQPVQVRSCPQNNTFRSQFNLEENHNDGLLSIMSIQKGQKPKDNRMLLGSLHRLSIKDPTELLQLQLHLKSSNSQESQQSNKSQKLNAKLIKQVRDNLDISDVGSSSSLVKEKDKSPPSKLVSDISLKEKEELTLSESGSEDEKEKMQQRQKFFERKNVKKKSTFYQQQLKETKTNDMNSEQLSKQYKLNIVEESTIGSAQCVNDENDLVNKSNNSIKKNNFNKQSCEQKAFNLKIKAKVSNMNIESDMYGDLEDCSPLIQKSNKSLNKMNSSTLKYSSNNSLKNNNKLIQLEYSTKKSEECVKISSNTSIMNLKKDESKPKSKNDLLSTIAQYDESNNKFSKITIANTIIQRSQRSKKFLMSQQFISPPNSMYNNTNSNSLNDNFQLQDPISPTSPKLQIHTTLKKKSFSSSTSIPFINISDQINLQSPCIQSQNSLKPTSIFNSKKQQPSLELVQISSESSHHNIIHDQINQNAQDFLESEANQHEQDLILKILLRQDNNNQNSSMLSNGEKSESNNSMSEISQDNINENQLSAQ